MFCFEYERSAQSLCEFKNISKKGLIFQLQSVSPKATLETSRKEFLFKFLRTSFNVTSHFSLSRHFAVNKLCFCNRLIRKWFCISGIVLFSVSSISQGPLLGEHRKSDLSIPPSWLQLWHTTARLHHATRLRTHLLHAEVQMCWDTAL